MLDVLRNLINDENGQGMVEYALVLGFLATGAIVLILGVRYSVEDLVYEVTNRISDEITTFLSD